MTLATLHDTSDTLTSDTTKDPLIYIFGRCIKYDSPVTDFENVHISYTSIRINDLKPDQLHIIETHFDIYA